MLNLDYIVRIMYHQISIVRIAQENMIIRVHVGIHVLYVKLIKKTFESTY